MAPQVKTLTPPDSPTPMGPYSHIAKVGDFITIGGLGGIDPAIGRPGIHPMTATDAGDHGLD